jgi:hypothetical protein
VGTDVPAATDAAVGTDAPAATDVPVATDTPAATDVPAATDAGAAMVRVRVAHLSPNAPAVDVCLRPASAMGFGGVRPTLASNMVAAGLSYTQVTAYLSVPAGAYVARIVAPGSANCDTARGGVAITGSDGAESKAMISAPEAASLKMTHASSLCKPSATLPGPALRNCRAQCSGGAPGSGGGSGRGIGAGRGRFGGVGTFRSMDRLVGSGAGVRPDQTNQPIPATTTSRPPTRKASHGVLLLPEPSAMGGPLR